MHSSTSSSESPTRRDTSRAVALTLAVFLIASFGIRRLPQDVLVPDSIALRGAARAELSYEVEGQPRVDVLLIGTSRLEKLLPNQVGKHLDQPDLKVVNLSVPRNSFFTIHKVLRDTPELLRDLKIVFIDIHPYQFDNGWIDGPSSVAFLRYRNDAQHSWPRSRSATAASVADYAFPIRSRTQTLSEWITGAQLHAATPEERLRYIRDEEFRIGLREWALFRAEYEEDIRVSALPPFEVSRIQTNALEGIRELLSDDTELVLVWLPFSDEEHRRRMEFDRAQYVKSVGEGKRLAAAFANAHDNVEFVHVVDWMDEAFEPEDFTWDGAHFTPAGLPKLAEGLSRIANHVLDERVQQPSVVE